jgi:hypothetical protein
MVRRALLLVMLMVIFISPALAQRTICDSGGECVSHPPTSGPDYGDDPQHQIPTTGILAGGSGFAVNDLEPFRSPDMGPLEVVLSTGEFQITVTDLEIPGRGFPLKIMRTYRSRRDGEGLNNVTIDLKTGDVFSPNGEVIGNVFTEYGRK